MLEEAKDFDDTTLTHLEVFPILDTIQESKESSSVSGESSEFVDVRQNDSSIGLDSEDDIASNVSKVRWIHDRDVDDIEDDNGSQCIAFQGERELPYHPNVDRGWAWVVCFSLFLLFGLNSGLLACTGLYYVQMLEVFKETRSHTAWLGSLMNAFFMLAGPVSSVVIQTAGCRISIMIGGIIMALGYILSATSNSLHAILFTYGIVVATGMNFVYSGQIISLAQYFRTKHSLATSVSMIGVGLGTFLMVRIIDHFITEYGWRYSFIFCAGFSLQICVLGSIIFPLSPASQNESLEKMENEEKSQFMSISSRENFPNSFPTFPEKYNQWKKDVLNRSVSSLKLSIGAGFLSSSITNLNSEGKPSPCPLRSNQNSFCSRTSQVYSSVRSNQESFSYMHSGEFPLGIIPFLKSNQHSFSSRGSFVIPTIHSNSQNLITKNSQMDLQYLTTHNYFSPHHNVEMEREMEQREVKDDPLANTKFKLLFLKIVQYVKKFLQEWHFKVFSDGCFWCASVAMFFNMFATMKMFVIYKDMSASLGVVEYYYMAMSALGVGDIFGRISMGFLSSYQMFDASLVFAINILIMGLVIGCHVFATTGTIFVLSTATFGALYGQQCVLMTMFVSPLFGKDLLVSIFGYILFISGLGALFGAPIAGLVVDATGDYNGVVLLAVVSCIVSGLSMFCCFWIHRKRQRRGQELAEFLA